MKEKIDSRPFWIAQFSPNENTAQAYLRHHAMLCTAEKWSSHNRFRSMHCARMRLNARTERCRKERKAFVVSIGWLYTSCQKLRLWLRSYEHMCVYVFVLKKERKSLPSYSCSAEISFSKSQISFSQCFVFVFVFVSRFLPFFLILQFTPQFLFRFPSHSYWFAWSSLQNETIYFPAIYYSPFPFFPISTLQI